MHLLYSVVYLEFGQRGRGYKVRGHACVNAGDAGSWMELVVFAVSFASLYKSVG